MIWVSTGRPWNISGKICLTNCLRIKLYMGTFVCQVRPQIWGRGYRSSEELGMICLPSGKKGLKQCQVGCGISTPNSGKQDSDTFRNSLITKTIAKFLLNIKPQMDTDWVNGCRCNEAAWNPCQRSVKSAWKHCRGGTSLVSSTSTHVLNHVNLNSKGT